MLLDDLIHYPSQVGNRYYECPNFTDKDTEAQEGQVTCLRPARKWQSKNLNLASKSVLLTILVNNEK